MSKEIKHDAVEGSLRHDNHTAPVSLTKRTLSPVVNYLLIKNRSTTSEGRVSFDGTNYFTIDPKESLSFEVSGLKYYWTGGSVYLEVLTGGAE